MNDLFTQLPQLTIFVLRNLVDTKQTPNSIRSRFSSSFFNPQPGKPKLKTVYNGVSEDSTCKTQEFYYICHRSETYLYECIHIRWISDFSRNVIHNLVCKSVQKHTNSIALQNNITNLTLLGELIMHENGDVKTEGRLISLDMYTPLRIF